MDFHIVFYGMVYLTKLYRLQILLSIKWDEGIIMYTDMNSRGKYVDMVVPAFTWKDWGKSENMWGQPMFRLELSIQYFQKLNLSQVRRDKLKNLLWLWLVLNQRLMALKDGVSHQIHWAEWNQDCEMNVFHEISGFLSVFAVSFMKLPVSVLHRTNGRMPGEW